MKYLTTIGDREFTITINEDGQVEIDGEIYQIDFQGIGDTQIYSLILNGQSYEVAVDEADERYHVTLKSTVYEASVEDERTRRLAKLTGGSDANVGEVLIKAPMPGVVVNIVAETGKSIAKGDIVVVLESMKMQNEFKAPRDGVISSVRVGIGDKVDQNAIMVTLS